ncbi:hypothetical protein [Oceanicoccus sagamiensis]|uniref:Sulfotransferase domain-containing protein n=1 Tax=Oceanicoccus sagamiensis TaxID=716816 RepID=A0A1X9NBR4_9GAMM|nr:hypothetical protein [Oceanicoccus sagamiensis]ARN73882.1 hypothetical protein BST96_06995 [Oceanicoccus sagamiensis]
MLVESEQQETKNKKLVLVLGMHRSGTSAITHALTTMGVELGDRLMPAIDGNNDKGFWEDLDVNALNIKMLEALDRDWHYLLPISEEETNALIEKSFLNQAVELLKKKIEKFSVFGLKDPRMAKLQPFWQRVFERCDFDVYYILPVRNPASVTASLLKRDAMPLEKGYFLWAEHTLAALLGSSGKNRIFIDYDQLLGSPGQQLERMSNFLGLEINSEKAAVYTDEFLETNLRHSSYCLSDILTAPECPSLVVEIYQSLLIVLEKGQESDVLKAKTEKWKNCLDSDSILLKLADGLSKKIGEAERTSADQASLIIALEQEIAVKASHLADIKTVLEAQEAHIADIERVLEAQAGHITDTERVLEAQAGQIADAESVAALQASHITDIERVVEAQANHIIDTERVTSTQADHIINLERVLEAQKNHIADIERVTAAQLGHITDYQRVTTNQEGHIADLERMVTTQGSHITDLEKVAEAQRNQIVKLEKILTDEQQKAGLLEAELEKFNSFLSGSYIARKLFFLYMKKH